MFYQLNNGHLNHPIKLILKDARRFLNLAQRNTMRDVRSGINLTLLNQAKHFLAIATVHPTGLEGEVLTIHVR